MISTSDIEALAKRPAKSGSAVLSVYLDTDQSREINIERGFEIVLKNLLREIREKLDEDKWEEFDKNAARVRQYAEEYRAVKRGIVIFCDDAEDFFWVNNFNVRVHNRATWDETPYLRPLVEILDEYERYGVVLADREKSTTLYRLPWRDRRTSRNFCGRRRYSHQRVGSGPPALTNEYPA